MDSKLAAVAVGPECLRGLGPGGHCCPQTETSGSALPPTPARQNKRGSGGSGRVKNVTGVNNFSDPQASTINPRAMHNKLDQRCAEKRAKRLFLWERTAHAGALLGRKMCLKSLDVSRHIQLTESSLSGRNIYVAKVTSATENDLICTLYASLAYCVYK